MPENLSPIFTDKILVCRDCGDSFAFTAGEQSFFQQKGLMNEPRRCPSCRTLRKQERAGSGQPETVSQQVYCAACGAPTTVPFVPRNGRPVYCSPCYDRIRSSGSYERE